MPKHRSHSAAFKRQVAEEFLAGETLRNLLTLVEAAEDESDLARIAKWILEQRQQAAMPLPQWHRLLGMLLQTPTFSDFSDFTPMLRAENGATGMDAADRRLLEVLKRDIEWAQLKELPGNLAVVSDARDFWHQTSEAWEAEYRSLQRQVAARRDLFERLLRRMMARWRPRRGE